MEELLTSLADGVLTITMNRPARKNALTGAMYERFAGALEAAEHDPAVRAVLICGVPGAFSAGNDLQDFLSAGEVREARPAHLLIRALTNTTLPLVAAVDGVAVGIGTTMLLHCDLVYAGDNAMFSMPFVNLGLCPEAASSLLVPRLMGHARAAETLLLGEPFSAESAMEWGLVNRIVPPTEANALAQQQARKLASKPLSSLVETKRLMKLGQGPVVAERMAQEAASFGRMLTEPAAREAFTAFMDKRHPDFSKL